MKFTHSIRFKITTLASISFAIVYIIVLGYLGLQLKKQAYHGAVSEIQAISNQKSATIKQYLENFISDNRILGHVFEDYHNIDTAKRRTYYQNLLIKVLKENPNMLAAWTIWEPNALDSLDELYIRKPGCTQIGSFSSTYYKDKGEIKLEDSAYDGILFVGDYYTIPKSTLSETILDPNYYSYTQQKEDEIMQTSTIVPIIVDNEFKGVLGFDINLENFEPIIDSIKLFETGYSVIITNSGSIVAHPNRKMVGQNMLNNNEETVDKHNIRDRINKGTPFSFTEKIEGTRKTILIHFTPFSIGKTTTPWALVSIVPVDEINKDAITSISITAILGIIGLILIVITGWLVIGQITKPLTKISELIKSLNNANLGQIKKISSRFKNEVGEIAGSTYTLINWLNNTGKFANEIKDKNYETKYELLNKNDTLGESLIEMRNHLAKADEEDKKRSLESKQHIWHSDGLSKIGGIISKNSSSIEQMSSAAIKFITDYVKAVQGGIFIINEDDEADIYYELLAAVAYSREKITDKAVRVGEGLTGRCIYEKQPILMTEIPQDYLKVTSGLGEANPNCILLVPIILNNIVFGVVELASFTTFEKYQVEFTKNICDSIASAISNLKTTTNTARLLEQSQYQSETLASQEEEMRQNMEEMFATQEEQEQQKEKAVMREENLNSIINSIPISLLTIDTDGNIKFFNTALNNLTQYNKEDLEKEEFTKIFNSISLNEILEAPTFTTSLIKKDKTKCNATVKRFEINNDTNTFHLLVIQEKI